jgi:predicted acetyltransferase
MIEFANEDTAPLVRRMWKTCFGDTDEYMDIIFTYKYNNENTLIYFVDGEAVASLQMFPYTINFYKQEIPFAYMAGLCTLPKHRKKGYMAQLIREAHRILVERNIPLAVLIPAETRLYKFYNKYGYEQVFEKDKKPIPLKAILDNHTTDFDEAYHDFDELFRFRDFFVQKSAKDFEAIVAEYKLEDYPEKTNLSGMARIIDTWALLDLYAKDNLSKKFRIKISDGGSKGQSVTYCIDKGSVELILGPYSRFDIVVDRRLLCRILFGYKAKELNCNYPVFFEEHQPILNLMLE